MFYKDCRQWKNTTNRNSTTTCKGDMYTAITKTSRVSIPYVFLFFGSFINVDARSLVLKNDELGQQSQTRYVWIGLHKRNNKRPRNPMFISIFYIFRVFFIFLGMYEEMYQLKVSVIWGIYTISMEIPSIPSVWHSTSWAGQHEQRCRHISVHKHLNWERSNI